MNETIPQALSAAVAQDPTTPLMTFYDDGSGDRTELSGATLDNWVAKTANLLVDGAGLGSGDTVAVLLPPHWQTAAILLGAWAAGLVPHLGDRPQSVDALFSTPDRADAAAAWPAVDRYATGLLPLAAPLRDVPAGYTDYVVEVRAFGDQFVPVPAVTGADPAFGGWVHAEICQVAATRAAELGVGSGDRVLVDVSAYPDPADWLLAPLVAGASVVLCANCDPELLPGRIESEKVTVTLT
ncbi:MAG TPA: TIGR03089 family protein [Actinoplanes sp.]